MKIIGNVLSKIQKKVDIAVSYMIIMTKKFFHTIIIKEQDFLLNKEDLLYWKNKIYYITAATMMLLGAPLMFYGAFLFYSQGDTAFAIVEVSIYIISIIIITRKTFSLRFKKYFMVYILYMISILLLLTTGFMGGGMICVEFSLILTGCLLEKKQIWQVVTINIFIFIILTGLLYYGCLDGTGLKTYKTVWPINVLTAQTCGIILLFLMNTIYSGLENQTLQIKKSEESLAADNTELKIREEEILRLSYHDSLTGLYNRTFFEIEKKRLDTESQLPLSVIIGDINGLKILNDSLGHAEGDKLLFIIGSILSGNCRKGDIISRQGGDEFSILLPRTSSEAAYAIIDAINASCENYNKNMTSELYHISISLGTATKTSIDTSLDNIFNIAEDYMYKRKLLEGRSFHSSIIASMKIALFEKSHETEEHAGRLIVLTKAVGHAIGLTNQQFDELELFAALHDIGKIGIDDQILNKPAKLTDEEWVKMKKHSEIGYRIAMASPELMSIAYFILTHHEHWDGRGYPQGLIGENIPLLSRILAIADAYDAMTHDRPYRKGMSKQEAVAELIGNAGTQFDPEITKIFLTIIVNEEC